MKDGLREEMMNLTTHVEERLQTMSERVEKNKEGLKIVKNKLQEVVDQDLEY